MNFNFCSFEKDILTDEIRIIANQLYMLGHRAYEGTNFIRREFGFNIVVSNGQISKQSNDEILNAAAGGAAFLYLSKIGVKLCIGNGVSTEPIELGHAKTLVAGVEHIPLNDFGVFGPLTPFARKMVKKLHRGLANVKIVEKFTDAKQRDNEFLGVRVILQLNDGVANEISGLMCNMALHVGRPVIAQEFGQPNAWNDIVKVSNPDTFLADCLRMRMTWKSDFQQQFVKFASKLTPEFCIGEPLRKLGIDISIAKKSVIHA